MTVVYTLGTGSVWENNELRYSIRSFVKYTAVDRIIIVGSCPPWLINAEVIPLGDGPRKQLNIHLKTLAACDFCDEFIQAADDHFILAPTDFSTYYYNGKLSDKRNLTEKYQVVVDNTAAALHSGALFYNLHIPMKFGSAKYKAVMPGYDWKNKDYLIKSLYFNNVAGMHVQHSDDVKVSHFMRREVIDKFTADKGFLSVGDGGLSVDMKRFLAERFPDKSIYEK
jgi:hypothetical protein